MMPVSGPPQVGGPLWSILRKTSDRLNSMAIALAALFIVAVFVGAMLQVITRNLQGATLTWTEELSRFSFVWATLLGASTLAHSRGHAVIEILFRYLPTRAVRFHKGGLELLIVAVMVIVVVQSLNLLPLVARQISPGMGLSMTYVYLSVPVSCTIIAIHAIRHMVADVYGIPQEPEERVIV